MTTVEQELTLFGGWAKVLALPQIELGVSRLSDTVSFSISRRIPGIGLRYYPYDPEKPLITDHAWETDQRGDWARREFEEWETEALSETTVADALQEHFKRTAFVRYIDTWGEQLGISPDIFLRGLSGTSKLKPSFSGMLGAMHGKAVRRINGQWQVTARAELYPSVSKMPEDGMKRMRSIATERKQGKEAA